MKNFEDSCVVFNVNAKPLAGVDFKDAVKECIKFAKATKVGIAMNFNGIDLYIRDYHTVDAIRKCYDEEIKKMLSESGK